MRGAEKRARPTQAPRQPFLAEYETFYYIFHKKVWSKLEQNGSAIFHSRIRLKVELILENGRNTSKRGSKSYIWLLVRKIHHIAEKTKIGAV